MRSILPFKEIPLCSMLVALFLSIGCSEAKPFEIEHERAKPNELAAAKAAVEMFKLSDRVKPFFKKSYGYAILPNVGKGGIGIGGAYGKGFVVRNGKIEGDIKMMQVSIGFQLGGQAYSEIIFFEKESDYLAFTSGNFELGAQASAVALTAGANAQVGTAGGGSAGAGDAQAKADYSDGIAIFVKAKGGLMYEASVGGQKFNYHEW